jgi:23S rRNA (cytosine1962-C5)-methyltransferase
MQIRTILAQAFEKREGLFTDADSNCLRLFNGEGDGIPGLYIDLYGEFILIQYSSPRPDRETADILKSLDVLSDSLPVRVRGVLMKQKARPAEPGNIAASRKSALLHGSFPPERLVVRQNGVSAIVDLIRGQNTGMFLDMREVRDRLAPCYRGSDIMLNLFSYTALFSVHAIKHGITGAVNVDLSKKVLGWAKANYSLNGIDIDDRDFVRGDSLEWIRRFNRKERRFSFIIFDPPTFSRNRKRTFSSLKNFRNSLALLDRLVDDGRVFTSINSFSISPAQYMSFHPPHWRLEFYANESSDFTHTGEPYLKAGLWEVKRS